MDIELQFKTTPSNKTLIGLSHAQLELRKKVLISPKSYLKMEKSNQMVFLQAMTLLLLEP